MKKFYLYLLVATLFSACGEGAKPTTRPDSGSVKANLEDENFFSENGEDFPVFTQVKQFPTIADSTSFLERLSLFLPEEADFSKAKVLNYSKIELSGRTDSLFQIICKAPEGLFAFCFTKKGENLYASRVLNVPKIEKYARLKDSLEQKVWYVEELLDEMEGQVSIYTVDSLGFSNLIDEVVPNQPVLVDSTPGPNKYINVPAVFGHEFRDVNGDGYTDLLFKGQSVKGGKVSVKALPSVYTYLFNPSKGVFVYK